MMRLGGMGLVGTLAFVVWIYAIFDSIAMDSMLVRNLPKLTWVLIVLFFGPIGAIAWLGLGRPTYARWRPGDTRPRTVRRSGGLEDDGAQEPGEVEGALENEQGDVQDVRFVEQELEVEPGQAAATYLENGVNFAVVLWGSSTCPPVGERLHVLPDEPNAVRIDLREIPQDRPCTMDLVPHTTVFGTKTSTVEPLVIHVGDETIELPVK